MKFEAPMSDYERRAFISQCPLADCAHSPNEHAAALTELSLSASAEPPQAAVANNNLLAFAEGVSRQNKQDVMDSFLFATMAANKQFNPQSQSQEWYARFNRVLTTLGWLSANWSYSRYRAAQQRFTMEQAGLEILASAIAAAALPGPASAAMLKVAADAVKALQAQEKPLSLFERKSKAHSGASFRIGTCVESADGTVNVAMGAVNFLADADVTNVLFWEWNRDRKSVV